MAKVYMVSDRLVQESIRAVFRRKKDAEAYAATMQGMEPIYGRRYEVFGLEVHSELPETEYIYRRDAWYRSGEWEFLTMTETVTAKFVGDEGPGDPEPPEGEVTGVEYYQDRVQIRAWGTDYQAMDEAFQVKFRELQRGEEEAEEVQDVTPNEFEPDPWEIRDPEHSYDAEDDEDE